MPDMRFAPPAALRPVDRGGGLNQTSVRAWNERHVMSLLRKHEWLSRMDITQLSGLSAQTVSVIIAALESDSLIATGALLRGKVGPPSRLLALNPDGAFALGLKIGLKSTDLVLMDFVGGIRETASLSYVRPDRDAVLAWTEKEIVRLSTSLPAGHRKRIVGIGVSLPDELEDWPLPDWPHDAPWREIDLEDRLGQASGLSVYLQNDATAAAGTEIILGASREPGNFAYIFVGARTAVRLVLDNHIHAGRQPGMPIPSLVDLAEALRAAGQDPAAIWALPASWAFDAAVLDKWREEFATRVVASMNVLTQFVDIAMIVVDGRIPADERTTLCRRLVAGLAAAGLSLAVEEGHGGQLAKAVGAASLPLHSRFMVDEVGLASRRE